jgi:hypothetical protein
MQAGAGGLFWNMHRRPVVQTVGIPRTATHASNVRDGLDAEGRFGKVDLGGVWGGGGGGGGGVGVGFGGGGGGRGVWGCVGVGIGVGAL